MTRRPLAPTPAHAAGTPRRGPPCRARNVYRCTQPRPSSTSLGTVGLPLRGRRYLLVPAVRNARRRRVVRHAGADRGRRHSCAAIERLQGRPTANVAQRTPRTQLAPVWLVEL